jgi:hypothetical protein
MFAAAAVTIVGAVVVVAAVALAVTVVRGQASSLQLLVASKNGPNINILQSFGNPRME